jgi:hypothetical protein
VLQHVTLEIPRDRVDACVAFWGLLGFAPIEVPPSLRDRFVWVGREDTHIHLMPVDEPVVPPHGHTAVVGDPEPVRDAGFDPQPGSNAWGAPRWFVHDPAGHRVEIMSAPPPTTPLGA